MLLLFGDKCFFGDIEVIIGMFSKSIILFTLISWSLNSMLEDINGTNSLGWELFFLSDLAREITFGPVF